MKAKSVPPDQNPVNLIASSSNILCACAYKNSLGVCVFQMLEQVGLPKVPMAGIQTIDQSSS